MVAGNINPSIESNGNLQTVYYPVESLIFAEYNPRQLTKDQYKGLRDSIERFGLVDPIIVNKHKDRKNIVVGGHQRIRIAQDLGIKDIPCVEVELDADREKELNVRLNRNTGEWDWDALANCFDVGELTEWGFTEDELQFWVDEPTEGLIEDDEIPEVEEAITQAGDLWLLGEHRLLCGDATKKEDVERLMDGGKADLCFTSPPYAEQRNYGGCDLSVDYLSNFMVASSSFCKLFCVNLGIHRSEGEFVQYWDEYISKAKSIGLKLVGWLIWDRGSAKSVGQQTAMFPIEHEWIFAFAKKPFKLVPTIENKTAGQKTSSRIRGVDGKLGKNEKRIKRDKRELGTVVRCQQVQNNENHPAQFPTELPSAFIASVKGNVLDPFMGSGTTLIACEQMNRKCYGMEIDPHYCDVIVKRWEEFTGKEATRLEAAHA